MVGDHDALRTAPAPWPRAASSATIDRVTDTSTGIERSHALVRADDPARPPALYRLPFSLAAIGLMLIALQAGKPVIGLGLLFIAMFTTASTTWRSFAARRAPSLALRAQAERALRRGRYGEARALYERSLALSHRDLAPTAPEVLLTYYSLATVHSMLDEREKSDEYIERMLDGLDRRVPTSWRAQVAWLLRRVAHQHSLAGEHARALQRCELALELVGPAPGADDTTVRSLLDDMAWIHHQAGDYIAAEHVFREALALHEQFRDIVLKTASRPEQGAPPPSSPYRVPGPPMANTTGGLDRAVAYSLVGLGWTLFERGRYDEARTCFDRAAIVANAAAPSMHGLGPAATPSRSGPALHVEILRGRAAVEMTHGNYRAADELYAQARDLVSAGHVAAQDAALAIDLGWLARSEGRYADADAHYEAAAKSLGKRHDGGATIACALHESLGELRRRQGRLRDAHREIARASVLAADYLGAEHPRVAAIEAVASRIHSARGDYVEAERCARQCMAVLRATVGAEHPRFAEAWLAMAEMHAGRGQVGAAEQAFRRALELREQAFGSEHHELAEILDGLGALLRGAGRDGEAEAIARRADAVRSGGGVPTASEARAATS